MKNIFLIICSIFLCQYIDCQTKTVYWVHGMSGDSNSLKLYANKYSTERKMVSKRPDVAPTNIGITGAANRLQPQIISNLSNIIIAHSMGGVNARQVLRQTNGQAFGGIITLGSPHLGAIVADNIDNGVLDNFISEATDKGLKGIKTNPVLMADNLMSYFGMGIVNFIANIFGGSTPNSLYDLMNQIPNYIIKKIADDALGSAITKNELKTNSPIIAGLQQYRPQMPMIAIYGIEDNPAFLRLAGARFDNKDNAKPLYQIDDTKVVSIVNTLADLSHSEVDVNNTLCYLSLLCIPCIIYYSWAADQWQISADYYSGQLQTGCDFLIGAKRNGYEDATYIDWVCDNSPKPLPIEMKSTKIAACKWPQDYHPVVKTKSVSIIISTPSDGLLPSDTEMGMPGCSETNKYQALHVNHEELKNHQSVTILLDQIFNGQKYDTRDPYFFKINPK